VAKIYVIGFGPGGLEHITPKAQRAIEESDIIVGYSVYVEILKTYFTDKNYESTGMMHEVERCRLTLRYALEGKTVSIISSGDSGIYGMAGIMLQIVQELGANVELEVVPGITAASAAASVLGAPIMHDFAVISLSDLLTPIEVILKRVRSASDGDFVICIYNPRSKKRSEYIWKAVDIVLEYRLPNTPVGIVRNAGREGEKAVVTTLSDIRNCEIDMFSVVIIGNSNTYIKHNKIITPRGYKI